MISPKIPDQLRAYREDHKIRPFSRPLSQIYYCEHDWIRIYRIRGGWKHDPDEIRALAKRSQP